VNSQVNAGSSVAERESAGGSWRARGLVGEVKTTLDALDPEGLLAMGAPSDEYRLRHANLHLASSEERC